MNRFYIGLYGVALSAAIACTSSKGNSDQSEEKRSVPYTQLKAVDTMLYTDYVADIQAVRNVEVRSKIQGFLDKIFVDEGALVQAGQILFKINDDEQRADVSKAQALLNNATADAKTVALELERVKTLVKKNIITKTDLDVAQAQLKAAEARVQEARSDLQRAQTQLGYTSIRAPFTGRIDRIPLKVGSLLSEGALLTSVSDLDEVYAYFTISETEYLQNIARKSPENSILSKEVRLTLADGQHYPHMGKIELAESEFEEQTGTISLRARFPNPDRILKHGATGKIQLPTKITESIIVPQKSVFEIQDRAYVYVLDTANTVKMTNIELGTRFGHFYLIRSGLKAGQKIVFEGTQSLTDGVAIEPREVSLDSLLHSPSQGLQ
ncbi:MULTISPECIES: efflux RND transporter periplasmic adaptor subunit [Olivibacter]|jgi:membrane fusion protein (multidrug efflux system)|uniref:Efflux transporter, RND family, MFP subunit n=3 Tax=Sphingobacteriaceae TaxID=84566 RepID=F4CDF8_SPHS2|nr:MULTISPECIES: efflux RND transporter periplasmic adaptor subunit [Olivibacter]MCL4638715.1 efflux RND transporter periplasmic adaptor subunit [Olivibacter sp. UJ_SKK_5.1]MDM8177275.1 efflux RND transporter periplasmic adaptor subunit [Olivibacter sp. 47]QEK99727.1 efflux RND transporter periplasmic adaptor subunit [Olivibacter sp. LS-1]